MTFTDFFTISGLRGVVVFIIVIIVIVINSR